MLKREIKNYGEIVFNVRFCLCVACIFLLFQLDTGIPMMFSSYHWSVTAKEWDIISTLLDAIYFGMYIQMINIVSTAGFGLRFCEEWKAGIVPWMVRKCGLKKYARLYVSLATLSGGSIAVVGFILYVISIKMHNVSLLNPELLENLKTTANYGYTLNTHSGIKYIIIMATLYFIVGALASVIAICMSTLITNKYFVMVSPYLIYRIYVEISKIINIPYNQRIDYYLFGRQEIGKSFWQTETIILLILVLIIIAGQFMFRKGLRRKLVYEKY